MKVFVIGTISGNFMLPPSGGRLSENHSVDNRGRDHDTFVLLKILTFIFRMLRPLSHDTFGLLKLKSYDHRTFLLFQSKKLVFFFHMTEYCQTFSKDNFFSKI